MAKELKKVEDQVPSFMQDDAGVGSENLTSEDLGTPRLQLGQGLSPFVQDGDCKSGNFWHSVYEEDLGNEVDCTIVFVQKRFVLWAPRHMNVGKLAEAHDAVNWDRKEKFEVNPSKEDKKYSCIWDTTSGTVLGSGLDKWGTYDPRNPDSWPAASLTYDYVLWLPDHPEYPLVYSCTRTQIGAAKKVNEKIKFASSKAPVYGLKFKITSVSDHNDQGEEFWNISFKPNGFLNQSQYETCKNFYKIFSEAGVKVKDDEPLEGSDARPSETGTEF